MNWFGIISMIACWGVIFTSIIIIGFYRKHTEMILQKILEKLDIACTGNPIDGKYDESMDSAISERLNRVVQITAMQRDAARKERDNISALILNISHQAGTPLSNIMLYSGLLLEERLEGNSKRLADKIQAQSEKLHFLLKELEKSTRIEKEIIVLSPKMVAVSDLIYPACQSAELSALKKKIEIRYEEEDCACYADIKWTIEAISNVLENAVKYSPEESVIGVNVLKYDSFLCIEICDSGLGIAEKEKGLIFQRFYRSQEVKDIPGFGIGLYLVREVLQKEGGYVKVQSRLGEGSKFQLFLSRYIVK